MKFLDPLDLHYVDGRYWVVMNEFDYVVGAPDGSVTVHVPAGFKTDFASVPRLFWNLISPTGWYGKAAVIHDKLYQDGKIDEIPISRKYADDVLNEAMCVLAAAWVLENGVTRPGYPQIPRNAFRELLVREIIYWGVRLGGWVTWNTYRRRERR